MCNVITNHRMCVAAAEVAELEKQGKLPPQDKSPTQDNYDEEHLQHPPM